MRGSVLRQAFGDDQAGFFRRAAFQQGDRARLLDAVDVGLGKDAAHLAVEVVQARDHDDGVRNAVGDLDEIAHGLLKALLGVLEEAQILDLIDTEHERGAIDGPHQLAETRDDLESAAVAGIRIEGRDRLMRQVVELAPAEYWRMRWSMRGSARCR